MLHLEAVGGYELHLDLIENLIFKDPEYINVLGSQRKQQLEINFHGQFAGFVQRLLFLLQQLRFLFTHEFLPEVLGCVDKLVDNDDVIDQILISLTADFVVLVGSVCALALVQH